MLKHVAFSHVSFCICVCVIPACKVLALHPFSVPICKCKSVLACAEVHVPLLCN